MIQANYLLFGWVMTGEWLLRCFRRLWRSSRRSFSDSGFVGGADVDDD
jgi:hypothetical protein